MENIAIFVSPFVWIYSATFSVNFISKKAVKRGYNKTFIALISALTLNTLPFMYKGIIRIYHYMTDYETNLNEIEIEMIDNYTEETDMTLGRLTDLFPAEILQKINKYAISGLDNQREELSEKIRNQKIIAQQRIKKFDDAINESNDYITSYLNKKTYILIEDLLK